MLSQLKSKRKYTLNVIKLNFDNMFIKHNWKHLGLHNFNMGNFKSQYKEITKFP